MDKKVHLKKPQFERKKSVITPELTYEETLQYLKYYFVSDNLEENDAHILKLIASEIKIKRNSYKRQDINKKKFNEDTFISEPEIYEKLLTSNLNCYYCRSKVCIFYKTVRQSNQWTLERINNIIGHSSTNTVISCLDCNLKRRNKSSDAFKFAKQLVLKKI